MVTLPVILLLGALLSQAPVVRVEAAPTVIVVDGRLDEHAWVAAEALPFAGAAATLRATHDGESLYIGVEARRLDELTGVRLWVGPSGAAPTPVVFPVTRNAVGSFAGGEFLSTAGEGQGRLEVRVYLGALGLADAEGQGLAVLATAETPAGSCPLVGATATEPVALLLTGVDLDRFRLAATLEGLPDASDVGMVNATAHVRNRGAADAGGMVRVSGAETPFQVSPGQAQDVPISFYLSGLARDGLTVDLLGDDGVLLSRSAPTYVDVEPLVTVRTQVPAYRATVYGSQSLDEGLFGVVVRTPAGTPEVDLTGALYDARTGASLGEQTLDAAPAGYYELSFGILDRTPGIYRFDATVRDGDRVLDRASSPLRILAYREPEVALDATGCLLIEGQSAFALGVIGQTRRDLAGASDLGFGLVLETSPAGVTGAGLDLTAGFALAGLTPPVDTAEVARLSLAPRLAVWWLDPATPEGFGWLAAADPFHPVVVPTPLDAPTLPDWQMMRAAGDIMLAPVGDGSIADQAFAVRGLLNADEWRRPVWCRVSGAAERDLAETTALAYACVIAGARGIVFDPGAGSVDDLARHTDPLLRELAYLADVLRAPIARVVPASSDDRVIAGVRTLDGAAYVIVVNTSAEVVTAELSDLSIASATSLFEDREMAVTDEGALTDTYAPYGVRLYRATPR